MGLAVVALMFQRMKGLVCDFPPGAPPAPARLHLALTHADVGHPTPGLALGSPNLPRLAAMAAEVWGRGMERQGLDTAPALPKAHSAGVALLIGPTAGGRRGLDLLDQRGMLPCFDTPAIVQTVLRQRLAGGSLRTQPVFGDAALEGRMLRAHLGSKALGSLACAIIFVRPSRVHHRLRPARHDGPLVRMAERGAQQLMRLGDGPMAVPPVSTRGPVQRLGRNILWASEGQEGMTIKKRHRFPGLAPRELAQAARAHRAAYLGRDRGKDCAPVGVARAPLHAVAGVQRARGPCLVKGQERGRLEGTHGERRHEGIGEGNLGIVRTVSWQAGQAASNQAKERIGGQMLSYVWRHDGQGTPRHEHLKSFKSGVFSHGSLRKASSASIVITGLGGSAGIAV
jgi:hypothetical protein